MTDKIRLTESSVMLEAQFVKLRVKGDVSTRSLIVQEGGEVNGLINMTSANTSPNLAEK